MKLVLVTWEGLGLCCVLATWHKNGSSCYLAWCVYPSSIWLLTR